MERKSYYLVGNAHLDPMWQWRWQDGSMEAKATLRSALDRMKEFPDFRFVCSSASIFQWVEEFAPEMLEEIRQRVQEGRFVIVGGWHVQPDCNLPSGEAFARQSLYAQRYFQKTFGVTATVGYCVDSFGHCATLPMILKNSGMNAYIYMRPSHKERNTESDVFQWTAPDGSEVLTYHILEPYCARFDEMDDLNARLAFLEENTKTELPLLPVFYGVGNHGGGPTIRHIELLKAYKKEHPEKELIFSDLQDFFTRIQNSGVPIPRYCGDLQHHASGCYAAEPRVKNAIRRAETELIAAENYSALSSVLCGRPAKNSAFHHAWDAVCFCHFHDSMDGCSIKEAHDDTIDMLGMAKHTAAVEENNALQTISWKINTTDRTLGRPLILFNPYGFEATQSVRLNTGLNDIYDTDGTPVASQSVLSSTQECNERPDQLFQATVPALGYRVYYIRETKDKPQLESTVSATAQDGLPNANRKCGPVLENEFYRIQFESYSGYILSFLDKQTNNELICARAAVPTVIDEFYHDTWSHAKNFFTDEMARFSDAQITVLENGPIRATVKVVSRYNSSCLTQYFSLEAGSKQLQVRAQIDWHEKHKLLKLAWPMNIENPKAYYEIPFGVIERPCDGEEEPGIHWTAVKGTNGGFALLNNNTYSSSVNGSTLYQTVVRSPIFGDHGRSRTAESDYTAQGITEFRYAIMPTGEGWSDIIKAGKLLNKGLTYILDTWHEGILPNTAFTGLSLDAPNVIVSAIKRSEDNSGMILRIYETDGKETDFTAAGGLLPCPLSGHITPWAVQTLFCKDGSDRWESVLLTEFAP